MDAAVHESVDLAARSAWFRSASFNGTDCQFHLVKLRICGHPTDHRMAFNIYGIFEHYRRF